MDSLTENWIWNQKFYCRHIQSGLNTQYGVIHDHDAPTKKTYEIDNGLTDMRCICT